MDEFRHRSFAQVCRAEANVSPSAPHRTRRREEGFGLRGRKEVQGRKRLGGRGGGRKRSRTRLTRCLSVRTLPNPLRTNPSVRSGNFRFSLATLQKGYASRFEPSFAFIMIHTILTTHRNSIAYACIIRRVIMSYVSKRERIREREEEEERAWSIYHSPDKWCKCVYMWCNSVLIEQLMMHDNASDAREAFSI